MTRTLKNVAAGCAAAMLLTAGSAGAANASYLGYGNGDPGNWSFYQEQHPQATKAHMRALRQTAEHHTTAQSRKRTTLDALVVSA